MKIKLIYPPRHWTSTADKTTAINKGQHDLIPPLGIARLTSYLRANGYNVSQDDLDIRVYRYNEAHPSDSIDLSIFEDKGRVEAFLRGKEDQYLADTARKILDMTDCSSYDVYGFSLIANKVSVLGSSLVMSKLLKDEYDSTIVFGGLFGSYERILKSKVVDYIITFHGDLPLLKLCSKLGGENVTEEEIPGLVYLRDGRLEMNDPWYSKEKFFPLPTFDGLPVDMYAARFGDNGEKVLVLPYMFIDGCTMRCAFCVRSLAPYVNMNDVETVSQDLSYLSKKYKTRYFMFLNSNLNPTYDYADKLATRLISDDLGLLWSDCANMKHIDGKLLTKLKQAGAVRLVFGLESASPRMLKHIGKDISIKKAEQILKKSNDLGIWNEVELIVGMPTETDEDLKHTIDFINRNSRFVNFFYLNTYMLKDSLIRRSPGKYGIANIIPLEIGGSDVSMTPGFDEIDGLKWEDKVKQQERYFQIVSELIDPTDRGGSDIHSLFYAYSRLD
jgi:hypothetical protein